MNLTAIGLTDGIWTARITDATDQPRLEVRLGDQPIESALPEPEPDGSWTLRLRLPVDAISDGLTVLSVYQGTDRLGGFIVAAGDLLQDDLRAQVTLLRAEVDLLKSTIRRLHGAG